jgi:hypothetical protein
VITLESKSVNKPPLIVVTAVWPRGLMCSNASREMLYLSANSAR